MAKHLIVLGHGRGPGGSYAPGGTGNGTNEDEFLNNEFLPALKKYAPSNVDFYTTKDMYQYKEARTITGYDDVTELHLDAASASASGGHVIIYKDYKPDEVDIALRDAVKKYIGLRNGDGFSYRSDLYNLNVFADRGITYRLVELAFVTNANDLRKLRNNLHAYAKSIIEAVTGGKSKGSTVQTQSVDHSKQNLKDTGFKDVAKGSRYEAAVKSLKEKDIMEGYENGEFGVKDNLTRGDFAVVVNRILDYMDK